MPESLLTILKFLLLILVYLFFFRVLRAVWAEVTPPSTAPAAAASSTAPRRPPADRGTKAVRLKVIEPAEQRGRVFPLGDEVTVGRAAGCQVRIDDTFASQLHARVYRRDTQLFVEDLGSTNGTYLTRKGTNGREKVNGSLVLRPGDRLLIGKTVLEVSR